MCRWLVVALALAACSKDEPTPAPAPAPAPTKPTPTPEKVDQPAPPLKQGPGSADLTLLPVDSELVLGVDFAALSASAVWKQMIEPQVMSASVKAKLADYKQKCGYDPMTVKRLAIGMKGMSAGKPAGVIVAHGVDKAKALACVDKLKDDTKDKAAFEKDGDALVMKLNDGTTLAVQFTSDDTALVAVGPQANAAGLKAIAGGKSPLVSSAAFVELFNKLDTGKTLWLVMNTVNSQAQALQQLGALGIKPRAVFGTLDVGSDIALGLRLKLETADQATQMAQMGKSQAGAAKSMFAFDKFDFGNDGSDLTIDAAVSSANLPKLIKQMGAMRGMQSP